MFSQPFKAIVVGVDFSSYSKNVVKQAQILSKMYGLKMVLVYAIADDVPYVPAVPFPFMTLPPRQSKSDYVARIKKFYRVKGTKVKVVAEKGFPRQIIIDVARKSSRPLIMVGHKGQSNLSHFFLGSTARSVVMKSPFPVWIQRGEKVQKPKRLLIPHDLTRKSDASIKLVENLALDTPNSYEIFYVNGEAFPILQYGEHGAASKGQLKEKRKALHDVLKQYPHLPVKAKSGKLAERIAKRSKSFDLIVMTHHNPRGLFSRSITDNVMRKAQTPLLVVQ